MIVYKGSKEKNADQNLLKIFLHSFGTDSSLFGKIVDYMEARSCMNLDLWLIL